MRRILSVAVILSSSICLAQRQTIHSDNSDWWSLFHKNGRDQQLKPSSAELDPGNFEIAGVNLTNSPQTTAIERLGDTPKVSRGDTSTARRQLCYVSPGKPPSFLIFESAEVSEGFYLFTSKKDWKQRKHCAQVQSTASWKTGTGLRLGMSKQQVQAILGKPDAVHDERFLYLRGFKQNNTDVTLYLDVRFDNSRLNYLAASRADTN
jgi:hypothetical protein